MPEMTPSAADATRLPRIRLARPIMGEEEVEAVRQVLSSGILTGGPVTARFEQAFAARHGVDHAVAFANGTVALNALYLALGIGAGDEVIVPSMTFISSATSVLHAGARAVFADIRPGTYNLDPVDVHRRITSRTKAILAVHYGGQPCDMDELTALADEAKVVLLEDAAEAHGASYRSRPVGSLARAGMFSFTPTKNITTGEGGMVTTDDGALAACLRLLRNHGQTSLYSHETLGYNWRLSEIHAAIGCVQLGKLDQILATKRANAHWMAEELSHSNLVSAPVARSDRSHAYMLYTTLVAEGVDRDVARQHMIDSGVEARLYFPPAHRQPIFADTGAELPVTDSVAARMLSIPFHASLTDVELAEVADTLLRAVTAGAMSDRLW